MLVEIDETVIKSGLEAEVRKITSEVILKIVGGWGFEEKIRGIVARDMDAVIQEVVTKELSEWESIRQIVHKQMVQRCKAQLNKAIKLAEVVE